MVCLDRLGVSKATEFLNSSNGGIPSSHNDVPVNPRLMLAATYYLPKDYKSLVTSLFNTVNT